MKTRSQMRLKRKLRIRAKIRGSGKRPRLTIFRSNRSLFGQIIDDEQGFTLAAKRIVGHNRQKAHALGLELATLAKDKKVTNVIFDRGGYQYHGIVAAFAEGAREGGLKF